MEDELDLYEKSENAGDGMGNSLLRESILGKAFKMATKIFVSYPEIYICIECSKQFK